MNTYISLQGSLITLLSEIVSPEWFFEQYCLCFLPPCRPFINNTVYIKTNSTFSMFFNMEKSKLKRANEPNLCIRNQLLDRFNIEFRVGAYIVHWSILIFFSYNAICQISKESKLLKGKSTKKSRNTELCLVTSRIKYSVNNDTTNKGNIVNKLEVILKTGFLM